MLCLFRPFLGIKVLNLGVKFLNFLSGGMRCNP